jgi:hypothetical protein
MVSRVVLHLLLCTTMGVRWVLEQPKGSRLGHHPRFQFLVGVANVFRHHIAMGSFGADTEKGSINHRSKMIIKNKANMAMVVCTHVE